jgi:hypothetical protein
MRSLDGHGEPEGEGNGAGGSAMSPGSSGPFRGQ